MTKREKIIKILQRLEYTGWDKVKIRDWYWLEKAVDKIIKVSET